MSTNVAHEKPETEEQPTVKKLRIAEDAGSVDSLTSLEDKAMEATDSEKTLTVDASAAETSSSSAIATPKAAAATPKQAASGFSTFSGGGFGAFSSGGGFSGFAKTAESSSFSSGFGAFASSDSSTGFSGFAKTADPSSGFGAFARTDDSSEGFTETASADVDPNDEEVSAEFTPVVTLTEAEVANGEEEERVVVEKRAKLFKLVGNDYIEVGVGPFRVLKQKDAHDLEQARATARMVMRRESYPRGPGTKLILNARLTAFLSSTVKSEKSLMVVIVEMEAEANATEAASEDAQTKIKPVTYLIRFSTNEDLLHVQSRVAELLPPRATST